MAAPGCCRRRPASSCSWSSSSSPCSCCSGCTHRRRSRRWPTTRPPVPPVAMLQPLAVIEAEARGEPRGGRQDGHVRLGPGRQRQRRRHGHRGARGRCSAAAVHPAFGRGLDRLGRDPPRRPRAGRAGLTVTSARCRGDAGQVGGIEALPFGLLVFVVGSLLIANAWAVVDAKFATDAAARQAVRTFVEGTDEAAARHDAVTAGLAVDRGPRPRPGASEGRARGRSVAVAL